MQERQICSRCGRERTVKHLEQAAWVRHDRFGFAHVSSPAPAWRCTAYTVCKNYAKQSRKAERENANG